MGGSWALRERGQPHHQGRGRDGIQAPPSPSDPANDLKMPWRRGSAGGEGNAEGGGSSSSPSPMKINETWKQTTTSSDGPRKFVGVQKFETVRDRSGGNPGEKEGGVALAKQAGTGEVAPKVGYK